MNSTGSRIRFPYILVGTFFLLSSLLLSACSAILPADIQQQAALLEGSPELVRLVLGGIGLLLLVAGFAIYRILIHLIGFVVGGVAGALLARALFGTSNPLYTVGGFVIVGLIGAGLAMLLNYLGIFLAGCYVAGSFATNLLGNKSDQVVPILIAAVVGGLLMLILFRFWVSILTAVLGAVLFGVAVQAQAPLWVIFMVLGVIIQWAIAHATGRGERVRPGYQYRRPPQAPPAYPM